MKDIPTTFQRGLTLKSFLITLLITPINVLWIIELEVVRHTCPTIIHPLANVIFMLFWLLLIRYFLGKISPKLGLSEPEVLTIYVMLCVVSCLCSYDTMEILIPMIGHPFRFATTENEWRELFWEQLPHWLTIRDEKTLNAFYQGDSSLYVEHHLKTWLVPVVAWVSFIFVLMVVMVCINTLLRVQWTERERLTYPIIQLPLEMTHARSGFFKNKLMWLGFGIVSVIVTMNILNSLYPSVPYIPIKRQNIHQYFTHRPWNAIGATRISFYPFVIGISFLIPLELLFSCWVFYIFYKMELIFGSMMGWRSLPRFPYAGEQGFGVYMGVLVFLLWRGRAHFTGVVRHLFSTRASASRLDDSREPMPYRLAAAGMVIGMIFLTVFSYKAGMSLWMIVIFFGVYFFLGIMITRLRAELGFMVHDMIGNEPHNMIIASCGTRRLGKNTLTVMSLYMFLVRTNWANPMPEPLEAFKIAERQNINPRHMVVAILLATFIGSVMTFWLLLDSYYRHGAESGYYDPSTLGFGRGIFRQLENWLTYPQGTDSIAVAFMGGGVGIAGLLMFLRTRFIWWPLHPLGYAMANSWGMYNLWSCVLVTWAAKLIILRYGGIHSYRRAIPFFLGMALGDCIAGSIGSILSIVLNTPIYEFFP